MKEHAKPSAKVNYKPALPTAAYNQNTRQQKCCQIGTQGRCYMTKTDINAFMC